jgi:hypothetical protein
VTIEPRPRPRRRRQLGAELERQGAERLDLRSHLRHGQPALDLRKCFAFNAASTALIDSYVSECHSTFDAQAVTGTNGPGPFKIVNNYLEAAAENIALGGAPTWIANMVPRRHRDSPELHLQAAGLEKHVAHEEPDRVQSRAPQFSSKAMCSRTVPCAAQAWLGLVLWSATAQVGCSVVHHRGRHDPQ